MPSVTLELAQRANALALEVIEPRTPQTPPPSSVDERITTALTSCRPPAAVCRTARALPRPHRHPLRAPRCPDRRWPPRQVRPRLSSHRSLKRPHDHHRNSATIGSTHRGGCPLPLPASLYSVAEAVAGSRPPPASTVPLVPSFCSIGTILPSRPARATGRRAQRRSRMARLRATAPAARSVLDGREHDGMLNRVGEPIPRAPNQSKNAHTGHQKA